MYGFVAVVATFVMNFVLCIRWGSVYFVHPEQSVYSAVVSVSSLFCGGQCFHCQQSFFYGGQ